MSLASALERTAQALPDLAEAIRPANGDPERLAATLEPEGLARVVAWLLAHELDAGSELLAALAEWPEHAAPLASLDEAELPKPARKVVRRTLHRLRSRGAAPARAAPRPVVARLARVADELEAAYVSSLDPSGARMLVLLEAHPSGGARLFELIVDEERGVLDFHVFEAPRRRARGFVKELLGRDRPSVVDVPPAAARSWLARVHERRATERSVPRSFAEWRSHLLSVGDADAPPGELARRALGDEVAPERVERAAALARDGQLGPWPPPAERLRDLAERLREAGESRLIVSGATRRERVDAALRECAGEAYAGERAPVTASRLRESAYVLWKREREEDARACLAAALSFEEDPVGGPVARALLEVALGPVLESLRSEEESSLIARPGSGGLAKP